MDSKAPLPHLLDWHRIPLVPSNPRPNKVVIKPLVDLSSLPRVWILRHYDPPEVVGSQSHPLVLHPLLPQPLNPRTFLLFPANERKKTVAVVDDRLEPGGQQQGIIRVGLLGDVMYGRGCQCVLGERGGRVWVWVRKKAPKYYPKVPKYDLNVPDHFTCIPY